MATTALLLVDDDDDLRSALTRALNRTGVFSVTPAEHGERALDILDAQPIDAILTDLQMPVMDGLTLLGHLLERGVHVPVAVMTGQQITADLSARLRERGIAASFSKPFEVASLADELQRALSPTTVGRLAGVTMFGFLQLLEVERKTALIVVHSGAAEGRLYFDAGALVHAETRWSRGLDTVYEIIGWPEPRLEIFYRRTTRERTIQAPLQHVLMEGARLLDESGRAAPAPPESQAPAGASDRMSRAIQRILADAQDIAGALGAALVDSDSGQLLGRAGDVPTLEAASAAAIELVRGRDRLAPGDAIEDVLVTMAEQYHVIRMVPSQPQVFLYVVLDRRGTIIGLARQRLAALVRRTAL